jgi:hypothetical protein
MATVYTQWFLCKHESMVWLPPLAFGAHVGSLLEKDVAGLEKSRAHPMGLHVLFVCTALVFG